MYVQGISGDQVILACLAAICAFFMARQLLALLGLLVGVVARVGVLVLGAAVLYVLARGLGG
ncbi:hypothetical protein [Kouleothrix sp.]|mgnify:CR=1 FL=1|uniref:hypothetical protein n=1 Tax=Kouleothrix sp. TaxID=2779161 RepID=UPI00391BF7DA